MTSFPSVIIFLTFGMSKHLISHELHQWLEVAQFRKEAVVVHCCLQKCSRNIRSIPQIKVMLMQQHAVTFHKWNVSSSYYSGYNILVVSFTVSSQCVKETTRKYSGPGCPNCSLGARCGLQPASMWPRARPSSGPQASLIIQICL